MSERGGGERGARRAGDGEAGRIRRLFRIRRVERDIAEELGFHFDRTVHDLVRGGMSRDAAEREARRRFGTEWWYRRELARIDRGAAVRQWLVDRLRGLKASAIQALGAVRRSPGLSAAIIAAFALGIGVNGTMFRIVDRLWLSPPAHIEAPDEVVRVLVDRLDSFSGKRYATAAFSYPGYQDLRQARGFAEVVATTMRHLTVGHGETATRVTAVLATGNCFRTLGVRAAIGRFFDEADDVAGVPPVVVLSYGYWQREFGGSAAVLGEAIDFGHGPHEIIGVAPRHFTGVDLERVDLWLPLHAAAPVLLGDAFLTQASTGRAYYWLRVEARLAPDVTAAAAAAEATTLHRAGYGEEIARGDYDAEAEIVPASLIAARGPLARPEIDVARWLAIVALLVLLIASVNVANLLLARVVRQRHETAICLALGVPRGRLVGQLLLEGLALGVAGGALAIGLAHFTAPVLGAKLLPDVDWSASATGTRLVAVTAGIAALAGLLAALPPAIQMSRRTIMDALRTSATGAATRSTARMRGAFVLVQAITSVLLLIGAALFVRSLDNARSAESMSDVMSRAATRSWELGATLFSAFGALALVLAALGLYAVLAFDVAQRMRELGVRVALGATRRRLMRDVIARGLRVTAIGVGIGLVLAWLLAPRLANLLFGVSPRDAVSYVGAAVALLVVALAASAIPAWMTVRADPRQALRGE